MELASQGLEHRAGMDLGWVDKSAIIDTLYDKENHTIYVFNEFYKSGCQLSELANAIENMNLSKSKLYVDSAEPRSIQYFKNEGINAVPATKGKDSVKAGLMFLQDNRLIVHPSCKSFITELENFSYKNKTNRRMDRGNHPRMEPRHRCLSLRLQRHLHKLKNSKHSIKPLWAYKGGYICFT